MGPKNDIQGADSKTAVSFSAVDSRPKVYSHDGGYLSDNIMAVHTASHGASPLSTQEPDFPPPLLPPRLPPRCTRNHCHCRRFRGCHDLGVVGHR